MAKLGKFCYGDVKFSNPSLSLKINDSSHETTNADVVISKPFKDNQDENIVDRQIKIVPV
ncbi:hypothetical protein CEN46_09455 [Fischerella thermalis CCMEE 5318]|uniref:Uncharacterized protein n=1 Tax=Fischerella thermalis CCMEE 5318 TaxID=2019666 RepID=A0A2N6LHX5_9CYAN|nr:hypothetical protein CEN46_09455 [Fischerella thermalis CCMEE 5318]PMB41870.1 hypothetical protein CEN47_01985 [Fischerella thermalis CCMEE 5319]